MFGEYLRDTRKGRGWSLRKMAEHALCSHTAIDKIEKGKFVPTEPLVDAIAAATGGSMIQLRYYARCDRCAK